MEASTDKGLKANNSENLKQLNKNERLKQYRQRKREKDQFILKEAVKLQNGNRELSLKEKEVLRQANDVNAVRFKKKEAERLRRNRIAALKPKEVLTLKKALPHQTEKEKKLIQKSEYLRQYRKLKNEKDELLRKEALKIQSESRELSLKEKEVVQLAKEVEAARFKKREAESVRRKRIAEFTPEKKEEKRRLAQIKVQRFRQRKRERHELIRREALKLKGENRELSIEEAEVLKQAEEIEAARQKGNEAAKEYRQKKNAEIADKKQEAKKLLSSINLRGKTVQEATELLYRNQNPSETEMSSEQKEILELAIQMKAASFKKNKNRKKGLRASERRSKESEYSKQYRIRKRKKDELIQREAAMLKKQHRELSLKEKDLLMLANKIKASKLKRNQKERIRRMNANKRRQELKEYQSRGKESYQTEGCLTLNEQISTSLPTSNFDFVINEIKIENEEITNTNILSLNHSSWSLFGPSGESCITEETNGRYFQILDGSKIDRRKKIIEGSLRSMRSLVENRAKRDEFAVFGKLIAQKLRSSSSDVAELKIAKLLIEKVLQNLAFGLKNRFG